MHHRSFVFGMTFIITAHLACSNRDLGGGDSDGKSGGNYAFTVIADDTNFAPTILKAQNDAQVKLTFANQGTKPHGYVIGAFSSASISPLPAGSQTTIEFTTPHKEGIYDAKSPAPGDPHAGQFIVQ
ncbi:MAG: hypothetical protein NVS3B20_14650 [Polyangiales bacterium]